MHDIKTIGDLFRINGRFQTATPYGSGHINDTYLAIYTQQATHKKYIFQRINHLVFQDTIGLMGNFEKIIAHIGQKVGRDSRRVLSLIPSEDGSSYAIDASGNYWRVSPFIERTVTHDMVHDPKKLFEAGRAFGEFQRQLQDLPLGDVVETIPDFHNSRWRFNQLLTAVQADPCNRAQFVKTEIAFAQAHEPLVDQLLQLNAAGKIPTRIIHNDTKINNLLYDESTGEALCVTDLDTVMPGLAHYDFGDLVRTAVSLSAEDEPNTDLIQADINRFQQLAYGYLTATHDMLNPVEREHLPLASALITFEIGIRFLTDFLQGDNYFKIHRPNHNLERARSQFKLVASIEENFDEMSRIINTFS